MTDAQIKIQEFQLIELLRDAVLADEFRLTIRLDREIWTVDIDRSPHADDDKRRGTGRTFRPGLECVGEQGSSASHAQTIPKR